jgi:hypothetical protein
LNLERFHGVFPHPASSQDDIKDLPPGISPKGEAADFAGHVARINAAAQSLEHVFDPRKAGLS